MKKRMISLALAALLGIALALSGGCCHMHRHQCDQKPCCCEKSRCDKPCCAQKPCCDKAPADKPCCDRMPAAAPKGDEKK